MPPTSAKTDPLPGEDQDLDSPVLELPFRRLVLRDRIRVDEQFLYRTHRKAGEDSPQARFPTSESLTLPGGGGV